MKRVSNSLTYFLTVILKPVLGLKGGSASLTLANERPTAHLEATARPFSKNGSTCVLPRAGLIPGHGDVWVSKLFCDKPIA